MRGEVGVPPLRDVVLLGGGHAHVQVLKSFGMRPASGLRLTVVAREPDSPYSGMLPGCVAGWYRADELRIDLARLSAFARARFVAAAATGLNLATGQVLFADRPPLRFDALSINTGGVPGAAFASDFVTPVKPIGRFLPAWRRLAETELPARLGIVGAGPGGVELALAVTHRYPSVCCHLVDAGPHPLARLAPGARRRLLAELARRGVEVSTGFKVVVASAGRLGAEDGRALAVDHVLWTTGVAAPAWPREAGLATDADGFVRVDATLRSVSDPRIFAAGDIAALRAGTRRASPPKSGVYAVRQGPALAANLRALATGRRRRRYRPQRTALAIIGTGDGRAVASRGRWHVAGAWVWRWKRHLDRRFMARFQGLPEMAPLAAKPPRALRADAPAPIRCGGCGAKLGADMLRRVLCRLDVHTSERTLRGIGDDAAVVRSQAGAVAMSCDGFRAMIDDVYRFGRISAHHAMNDLFAMGAQPTVAMALATVPPMAAAMMEEDLYQLMAGALAVLAEHDVDLVGGHSAEGAELSLGFGVVGPLRGEALAKGGLTPGQALVLTKPVGTGALLAGAMRGRCRAAHLVDALNAMDTSSAAAAQVLREHGSRACTDVTGFGLAGHLTEMTRASNVGAVIQAARVPVLDGALELIEDGVVSSLQVSNERALEDFTARVDATMAARLRALADPQTAGGMLAGVPVANAAACVRELARRGYRQAAVIGETTDAGLEIR